jgi:hypothetical protein
VADADAERFKWSMLRVAAENDPWNTGMAWSDAIDGLPGHTQAEIDRMVEDSLHDLLESGYIFSFQAASFDDEFAPRTEADALDKAEVLAAFEQGDLRQPGFIGLSFCATDAGRERFATLPDEASRLFPARDTDGTNPPHRPSRAVRFSD